MNPIILTKHSRLVSKINNKKKKEKNNKKKQTLKVDFWDKQQQQKNKIHDNNKISSMGFDNIEINFVFRLNWN